MPKINQNLKNLKPSATLAINQKVKQLSGGQKKRLALANVLINKPELLILDEPTNHLDLEMIEWLEQFFAKEKMTIFMVTHDRYSVNKLVDHLFIFEGDGKILDFNGDYDDYWQLQKVNVQAERDANKEASKNDDPKAKKPKSKDTSTNLISQTWSCVFLQSTVSTIWSDSPLCTCTIV